MRPSVSIILVTYNSAAHIPACCATLCTLAYDPSPEIVVVDNASQDASVALVRQHLPNALLLPQAVNHGFAGGVQIGVAASQGEYIVLLNPDTLVDAHWLDDLIATLDMPGCGVAGSKILDLAGRTILHAGGQISQPELLASHRGYGEMDRGQYEESRVVPFVTGASLALRRSLWDRLGGLDAGFFPAYFEDVDLCWRAAALGWETRYAPHSVLRHSEGASTGRASGAFYYYHHRNRLRLACKHLTWMEQWNSFSPAEAHRLALAAPLDRAVAGLVYREALPYGLAMPDAPTQAQILEHGRILASIPAQMQAQPDLWPEAARLLLGYPAPQLSALLAATEATALLHEHQFHSRLPLVGKLRRAWNSVATRWYVLPVLHQQTRFNQATHASLVALRQQIEVETQVALLETQLRQALLCYRVVSD